MQCVNSIGAVCEQAWCVNSTSQVLCVNSNGAVCSINLDGDDALGFIEVPVYEKCTTLLECQSCGTPIISFFNLFDMHTSAASLENYVELFRTTVVENQKPRSFES